jgi:hypothetical protein
MPRYVAELKMLSQGQLPNWIRVSRREELQRFFFEVPTSCLEGLLHFYRTHTLYISFTVGRGSVGPVSFIPSLLSLFPLLGLQLVLSIFLISLPTPCLQQDYSDQPQGFCHTPLPDQYSPPFAG